MAKFIEITHPEVKHEDGSPQVAKVPEQALSIWEARGWSKKGSPKKAQRAAKKEGDA